METHPYISLWLHAGKQGEHAPGAAGMHSLQIVPQILWHDVTAGPRANWNRSTMSTMHLGYISGQVSDAGDLLPRE